MQDHDPIFDLRTIDPSRDPGWEPTIARVARAGRIRYALYRQLRRIAVVVAVAGGASIPLRRDGHPTAASAPPRLLDLAMGGSTADELLTLGARP